jgi:hypothetical protein
MFAFLKRLSEPSTHAALAALVGAAGTLAVSAGADPHAVASAGLAAQAAFGLLGVFLPEQNGAAG